MTENDRQNKPENIVFEFEEHNVVPAFTKDKQGVPYSGRAEGSVGAADWSGSFENGLPHGKLLILWGGIQGGKMELDQGRRFEKT